MRSVLFTFFAVIFAALVAANPNPEPEPNRFPVQCGGRNYGACPHPQTCQPGPRQGQFQCKAPAPVGSRRPSVKRAAFCEEGAVACPVVGTLHGFECINIKNNIEQCGDCAVLGGVDCSALPGVDKVGCVNGFCRVESCTSGFVFDFRKRSCVPAGLWNVQPGEHQ